MLRPSYSQVFKQDQSAFFPESIYKDLKIFQMFPSNWWSFYVAQKGLGIDSICRDIKYQLSTYIEFSGCDFSSPTIKAQVRDWATDLAKRTKMPPIDEIKNELNQSLSKLSLAFGPSGADLLDLISLDPLETYKSYLKQLIVGENNQDNLKSGYLIIDENIFIPLKLSFPSTNKKMLKGLIESIPQGKGEIIGPYRNVYENYSRARKDMKTVSFLGAALLIIFLFLIIKKRKTKNLFILFPVLAGFLTALLSVIMFKRSIHGLTLSFGITLVGLSLDYGIHWCFFKRAQEILWTNLCGLVTTLIVLACLLFSEIPLLNELALFSIFGLSSSFLYFYFFKKKFPHLIVIDWEMSTKLPFGKRKRVALVFALGIALLMGLKFVQFDFSLKGLEMSGHASELEQAIIQKTKLIPPHFLINKYSSFKEAIRGENEIYFFSNINKIKIQNLGAFIPPEKDRHMYYSTWNFNAIESELQKFSEYKIFWNYFDQLEKGVDYPDVPKYAQMLMAKKETSSDSYWLSLFYPENEKELSLLQEMYQGQVKSLRGLVGKFSALVSSEILYIGSTSILLIFFLLIIRYRNLKEPVLCLVPFISALSVIILFCLLTGNAFSFIHFAGCLMVYGMSIDYSIFTIEAGKTNHFSESKKAMLLTGFTTFIGATPLLFCQHPVLFNLGMTLSCGIIGIGLGCLTIWQEKQSL